MGKKGGWFSAVKRAFSHESNKKKDKKSHKEKKKWLGKQSSDVIHSPDQDPPAVTAPPPPPSPPPTPHQPPPLLRPPPPVATPPPPLSAPPHRREILTLTEAQNEQNKHAYSLAIASAAAAEAAAVAAQAAAEVVRLTTISRPPSKSKEELAAIKIQTAFRGYMARRTMRAVRGLVRLKSLLQGQSVKRQAASTLKSMQTLSRLQSEIRARRIRILENNDAIEAQPQEKHEKESVRARFINPEEWNDSTQSREQIEAKRQNRQEAAVRRERALAYAFFNQRTRMSPAKTANATIMDPRDPHWGWSWLERWMAARPWETKIAVEQYDRVSVKSAASHAVSVGGMQKDHGRHELNLAGLPSPRTPNSQKPRPPSRQSPSTPPTAPPLTPSNAQLPSSSAGRKTRPSSSKGGSVCSKEDDMRSLCSVKSEMPRRCSAADSKDDASIASLSKLPSYMATTESARARSRFSSPTTTRKNEAQENRSPVAAKKRLSFPDTPNVPRRHSGPPKSGCQFH